MKKQIKITTLIITLIFSLNLFAETKTFPTITDALNYSGDRNKVTKLVIIDSITGSDYHEGSEWREFRTLDQTFPNIHSVEILTDQDIPDNHLVLDSCNLGMFFISYLQYDSTGKPIVYGSNWLKHFSAPNVKKIGRGSFYFCEKLLSINLPKAEIIGREGGGGGICGWCESLIEINLPKAKWLGNTCFAESYRLIWVALPLVERIERGAFANCKSLSFVYLGTDFTEPTMINFGHSVFGSPSLQPILTPNIELALGEYVLPKPDTIFNIWQSTKGLYDTPYIWKKINWTVGIEENEEKSNIFEVSKNVYYVYNASEVELFDLMGRLVRSYSNETILDLNDLAKGVYFLKIFIDGKYTVEKIVVN